MTDEQFELIMQMLLQQTELLTRLVQVVEARQQPSLPAPGYIRDIKEFHEFDWSSIGASVAHADDDGAAVVTWCGRSFIRRSPANRFKPAIWFSRSAGKGKDGAVYERLITFKELPTPGQLPTPVKTLTHTHQ